MRARLRSERGSALVVSVLVMVVMTLMGLGALSLVDGQSNVTAMERAGESNFNLVDAALKSQMFLLSQSWPSSSTLAYPTCTNTSTSSLCPDTATVAAQFGTADYASGITWTTQVQDNGGTVQTYYTTAGASGQPSYDANSDGKVWLRATATLHGVTRVLVAQVQQNKTQIPFPRNVITAGFFGTNNTGKKTIVQTQGAPGQSPATLAVRCTSTSPQPNSCLNYPSGRGQISPDTAQTGYTGGNALTSSQLDTLRSIAKANGTYYASGCPASPSGAVVFVESGNCTYGGAGTANSASNPGMFIIASGTLTLGGNWTYYGVIYAANLQGSSGYVVTLTGTAQVNGAVAVDGNGGVLAGASGTNIVYNPNAFAAVVGYAGASVVQGSWRELAPSQ